MNDLGETRAAAETQGERAPTIMGIVGGVASGKSQVAGMFGQLGATVIDADQLGHQVLAQPAVVAAAQSRWGDEVIDETGRLRREIVARHVFGDTAAARHNLEFWQHTTHPRIRLLMLEQIRQAPPSDGERVVILDAALLLEVGWDEVCDQIVFVAAPRDVRLARALRRGWTKNDFTWREAAQMDIDEKRSRADFVIDNSQGLDQTYEQVLQVWNRLHS